MTLTLNRRVWVLAERLCIHTHSPEEFLKLLRQCDIDFDGEVYNGFQTTKGRYTFMSGDDYTFASSMQLVPAYKYLPLLQGIVFDEEVEKTALDNWNYYGEFIRNWYPELLDLIKLSGVEIRQDDKQLEYPDIELAPERQDFLADSFGDYFLDYIRKEANECYQDSLYLSVMFLSRKILETVIVRVFEIVFPKLVKGEYSSENHESWYNVNQGRYHNFETLLDNLKAHAGSFHEDKGLVQEMISLVRPFKDETNKCIHYDYKVPDERYINEWRIPRLVSMARKIYRKYCNP